MARLQYLGTSNVICVSYTFLSWARQTVCVDYYSFSFIENNILNDTVWELVDTDRFSRPRKKPKS